MSVVDSGNSTRARRREARLQAVLDAAVDAVVTIDEGGRIESFNPAAERLFGYAADEVLGRNVSLLMPEPYSSHHDCYLKHFLTTGVAHIIGTGREVVGRRKDGSGFPMHLSVGVADTPDGRVFAGFIRDLTEQKRAEADLEQSHADLRTALAELRAKAEEARAATAQLWQAAKLAAVGELAAGIAHELNNPLATVGLRVEALFARAAPDSVDARALEVVGREVERMGDLVAGLLQFSRRGPRRATTLDVRDELRRTLDLVGHLARRRRVAVAEEFASDAPPVCADPDALRQVFLNLLTNALDAMPGGGTLTLRARPGLLAAGAAAVTVEVADTGAGIPPDVLLRIWDPFFTTKEDGKGTGLGLPICRRVVHENGGAIDLDSAPGRGTVARVLWPVAPPG
jgi:two-component system sensor kinase FixL